MQLIKKMFGRGPGTGPGTETAQFQDSEDSIDAQSRSAPRRELVQVVLRDSMRRHGIPSAWIDCRILSVVTRSQRTGMHVQLIVRDGIDRLLTYVPAFQASFMEEIARFDPRVDDWLFSISWQFLHLTANSKVASLMPDPAVWAATTAAAPLVALAPTPAPSAVALAPAPTWAPRPAPAAGREARAPVPTVAPAPAAGGAIRDEEMLEDLQALYAIRDAAMHQGRPDAVGPAREKDFESTRPGEDGSAAAPPSPRR